MIEKLSKNNKVLIFAFEKGYRVINGEVISHKNKKLIGNICKGYKSFYVYYMGKSKKVSIHRFIAYQKYGEEIFKKGIVVRHKNGNSLDNSEKNILIGTHSENYMDIPKEKRLKRAINASNKTRRFTDKEVKDIKKLKKEGVSTLNIGNIYNVGQRQIRYIVNNNYVTIKN